MVRSILLRGFDQECANKIGDFMKSQGVHFLSSMVPSSLERLPSGRIRVKYQGSGFANSEVTGEEEFDTVVSCVGRYADTERLGLDALGVKTRRGKILSVNEQTSVANIYAIGDVLYGKQELTPVAIQAGRLLARRLFGGSSVQMNYENVPMTVFTPLEYGTCGLTEETALERLGEENVEVYVSAFTPLEWQLSPHRAKDVCFAKLITRREDGVDLGFHIRRPRRRDHAGLRTRVPDGREVPELHGHGGNPSDHRRGIHYAECHQAEWSLGEEGRLLRLSLRCCR